MFRRRRKSVFILALLGVAIPAIAQSNSIPKCSVRMLEGTFGFSCSGVAPNPFTAPNPGDVPLIQPFAMNGTFTGDGKGQIAGPGKVSFNGTFVDQYATTTKDNPAVVNTDCSGHNTYQLWMGDQRVGEMSFDFVLVNNGNEGFGMPTNPGMTVTCHIVHTHTLD